MSRRANSYPMPRPFLKWVGGKRQLLEDLRRAVEAAGAFGRYHEPFVGGGALFFDLHRRRALGNKYAYLSDNNANLIDAYRGVKKHVEEVIERLEVHKAAHGKEYYYEVRAAVPEGLADRAARIIYLNKTCFNGLYRENSKGEFNVPMGKYKNPPICDAANLREVSSALKRTKVEQRPFATVLERAEPGDFVYFDPPYHPTSRTANFTAYDKGGFGEDGQRELAKVFTELTERSVKVLLSNSKTSFILKLYKDRRFKVDTVHATRLVNSRADRRGAVEEVLVRNYG